MCFFKKKLPSKIPTVGKFARGSLVLFKDRDDYTNGIVYLVHKDINGNILYDIQVGGECPVIVENIDESRVRAKTR